jgi:predicted nucleotidyltransferase component of viral defense system
VLDPAEAAVVAARFGVAREQVRRDHFLSHLLAALATVPNATEQLVFFGGTALARTHVPDGRLSEDIDLLALSNRRDVAESIQRTFDRRLRREFGRLRWQPPLHETSGSDAAVVATQDGLSIRVQLLPADDYPNWPTEMRVIDQRYSDVPATQLRVLTLTAFVVAKTMAWAERAAARDLYDLHALASLGAINDDALGMWVRLGPTGKPPGEWLFSRPPAERQWQTELAAQTTLTITAAEALQTVQRAWLATSAP